MLKNLQNKPTLKVYGSTLTTWTLDTLKWLNVRERIQVNTIYFIQKMKIGDASDYITEQLTLRWGNWTIQFEERHGLQNSTS